MPHMPFINEIGIKSPWAIICYQHDTPELLAELKGRPTRVYLTREQYDKQMSNPNARWKCPACGACPVEWDDDNYEEAMESEHG